MPDDWPGHPQRKDYPLGGIPVEYKGATIPPPDTRRSFTDDDHRRRGRTLHRAARQGLYEDDALKDVKDERIVVNMGPQHPSTHGGSGDPRGRDGHQARAGIGYLHTGIEKNMEYRSWTQGTTFVTRMDYLSPIFNETAYVLGVEKLLLGIGAEVPEKADVIRVLLISSTGSPPTWWRSRPVAWTGR